MLNVTLPTPDDRRSPVRILTNFMNSAKFVEVPGAEPAEVICSESWPEIRRLMSTADIIVIDCRDTLLYRIAARFLLLPWTRRPLVAVDLVLRKPVTLRHRVAARIKRLLFGRVDHFVHYFRDLSGYTRYFGISAARSSYVPFKVNSRDVQAAVKDASEEYIFTMGRSLRDYDTFIRAVAELPFPAAIPEFSFDRFEGKDQSFHWTRENIPKNLTVLPDAGGRRELVRNLSRARVVVIPTRSDSLCASGLSTYLEAMYLGKCVIASGGPGTSDLLTDQAILVPPHDVAALKAAIVRVWEDHALRRGVAEAGRRYAASLGGEPELLCRIHQQAVQVALHSR
jgi:glycosyltransferase involved in cell wall biosynthesis